MSAENCTNRNQRRGAAVLLEVLRSEGARHVFGNPGTTELPLIDALVDAPDISYILALQEASAVAMADGYAQAAGRPGVLNLHTTGGLGHGLGNLLNAHVSGTPLVVTAGQQDSRHTLTGSTALWRSRQHRHACGEVGAGGDASRPDSHSGSPRISRLSNSADRTGVPVAPHGCYGGDDNDRYW
jgi:2-succinyl-5-enolpyruvyl-6-hydroxy-3-cyclohexene-1-carboxylate synthase